MFPSARSMQRAGGVSGAQKRLTREQKDRILKLFADGMSLQAIARSVGCHHTTVWRLVKGVRPSHRQAPADPPKDHARLNPRARKALADFPLFFETYIGPQLPDWDKYRRKVPAFWRKMAEEISFGEHRYLLINVAPGHGKTTCLMAYVIWRLARDRNLKVVWISKSEKNAKKALRWITHQFERNELLLRDFGRFRPDVGEEDTWTKTEIIVAGADQVSKEASIAVYGSKQAILGTRVGLIIGDDVADLSNSSTPEQRDDLTTWWHTEVESRLEPDGVLAAVGSRLGPFDLYAELATYTDPETSEPVYHRIRFPAHDASLCGGDNHGAYPTGCVLWPERWPYKALMQEKGLRGPRFDLMYQQLDVAPGQSLARKEWIEGGIDEDGHEYPGCLDRERGILQLPEHLSGKPFTAVVTIDPSPSRWWSIQYWVVAEHALSAPKPANVSPDPDSPDPASVTDYDWYLLDHIHTKMGANQLLDGHEGRYSGVLEDLWQASQNFARIQYVILESNAHQRWLMQFRHAQAWQNERQVAIIAHTTGKNKSDDRYGIWALASRFKFSRIHLPYADVESRAKVQPLIDEATTWPNGQTDDCVMASWFLLWHEAAIRPRMSVSGTLEIHSDIPLRLIDGDLPDRLMDDQFERVPLAR